MNIIVSKAILFTLIIFNKFKEKFINYKGCFMKKIIPFLVLGSMFLVSCNKKEAKIESDDDKTFYSVGHVYGKRFKEFKLNEREVEALMAGVRDGMTKDQAQVDDTMKYAYKFRDIIQSRLQVNSKSEKENGAKFLDAFVANEGGTKTASGLAYKILNPGSAEKPKSTDTVEVHYKGTLTNGTEFDSSYKKNKPIDFPLDKVIKGWTEGVQLIGKGGKIKLVIPSELAYGDQGAPPSIPGGATLVFEVELLNIKK